MSGVVVRWLSSSARVRFAYALALLPVVLLVAAQSARSSGPTNVSGAINSDTTWTAANSPYVLNGLVSVSSGVTLTIQPGVVVQGSSQSANLSVYGSLSALGSSSQPITFTSASDSAPAQWGGIGFQSGSGTSTLQYVNVRYGGGTNVSAGNGDDQHPRRHRDHQRLDGQ